MSFLKKEGNAVMYREYRRKSREIIIPLITRIVEQGLKKGHLILNSQGDSRIC